jgi:hypothetical protein
MTIPVYVIRDDARDVFRAALLLALDEAARSAFSAPGRAPGASDADLPRLFRALDEQVETLAERYGIALVDFFEA